MYVTGKLCNLAFNEMPKDSRQLAKSLIHLGILSVVTGDKLKIIGASDLGIL